MKIVRIVHKIPFVELFPNFNLIPYVMIFFSNKDLFDSRRYLFYIGMIVRDCLSVQDLPCGVILIQLGFGVSTTYKYRAYSRDQIR